MPNHEISNYSDYVRLLLAACDWMGIDRGRASQYTSLIKQFFEEARRSREHILAYNESCEITEIYELWQENINGFPDLRRKIRSVFRGGPVLCEDERSPTSSNRARNDAFVYLLAGKLIKAGITVVAVDGSVVEGGVWETDADITFCCTASAIDVECKRPLSPDQVRKRVKEACRQLTKATTAGRAGIIALDSSAFIRPMGTLIEKDSAEEAVSFLGDLLERDVVPQTGGCLKPSVLGLILFARAPAMVRKGHSAILSPNGTPLRRYFRPESVSTSLVVKNPQSSETGMLQTVFEILCRSLH